MRTTLLLNQHKKCECLLEMIVKCDQRIASYKQAITEYKKQGNSWCIDWYHSRWEITLAIKERLAMSYANMLSKIVKPTVEKILQTA